MTDKMTNKMSAKVAKAAQADNINYGYYSKVLNKPFDSIKELVEAEGAYNKAHAAELQAKEERKSRASEIERAYKYSLEVRAKAKDEISKADKAYQELVNKFIEDYGSYHMTYSNKNGVQSMSIADTLDAIFDGFFKLI